jgi:hypothetical protein
MKTRWFLPLLAVLPLLGCMGESGDGGPDSIGMHQDGLLSESGRITAEITADQPIELGPNDLVVELAPAGGEAIEAIEVVAATALMPAHGHDGAPAEIVPEGRAYRLHELRLSMSGRWEITLDLRADGASDTLRFAVEVP